MDIWLNEPRRGERSQAPANLLRFWFPESVLAFDAADNLLWEATYEDLRAPWKYENLAIADMKSGRKIRKALVRTENVHDLALIQCGVRWEGMQAHLSLDFNNVGPVRWHRLSTSTCLQRSATPEYIDEDNDRTFVVSDGGFVASRELVFPSDRPMIYGHLGKDLPMQDGSKRTLTEEAMFVVSKNGRYVLGYGWKGARRLFLNRSLCVRCLHSDVQLEGIDPGMLIRCRGTLFLEEGSLEQALERFRAWKESDEG